MATNPSPPSVGPVSSEPPLPTTAKSPEAGLREGEGSIRSVAGYLEDQRRLLRAQWAERTLTPEQALLSEEISWAENDPQVSERYRGQFVVPWGRRIITHGEDADTVLQEAAGITGREPAQLPLVCVIDPLIDVPR